MNNVSTDSKIVAILNGGDNLLRSIDPDGLFSSGRVNSMMYHIGKENDIWGIIVGFRSSSTADVRGTLSKDGNISVISAVFRYGQQTYKIDIRPNSSLSGAFGDLSLLPVQMKADMGQFRPRDAKTDGIAPCIGRRYFFLVRDAASWIVGEPLDRVSFPSLSVRFLSPDDGSHPVAEIGLRNQVEDGFIEILFKSGVFGLYDKHVYLHKNLGQGQSIICECISTQDNRRTPSVKLAYDLSKDLVAKVVKTVSQPVTVIDETVKVDTFIQKKKKKAEVKQR